MRTFWSRLWITTIMYVDGNHPWLLRTWSNGNWESQWMITIFWVSVLVETAHCSTNARSTAMSIQFPANTLMNGIIFIEQCWTCLLSFWFFFFVLGCIYVLNQYSLQCFVERVKKNIWIIDWSRTKRGFVVWRIIYGRKQIW